MKYSRNKFLMGTDIEITILAENNPIGDIYNSLGIFYSLEKEFSRFLEDSDLNILNKDKSLEVSNRFIEVLNLSREINIKTNNYFNPLINLNRIGYSKSFEIGIFKKKNVLENLNLKKISIKGNTIELNKNQNIDLGGIVKGYGVDLVSEYLDNKGYKDYIINAGGDIYLSGLNVQKETNIVAIDNPFNKDIIFATLEIKNQSISTSGTYNRKWKISGEEFNHIISPETDTNNNEIISVSLIADKCYISDTYATACIAMGIKKSLVFLKEQNIDGIIIGNNGNIYKTKGMIKYNLEII